MATLEETLLWQLGKGADMTTWIPQAIDAAQRRVDLEIRGGRGEDFMLVKFCIDYLSIIYPHALEQCTFSADEFDQISREIKKLKKIGCKEEN